MHWLDAGVLLILAVGCFWFVNWFDSRARLLTLRDGWDLKRLRGNPTAQIALLLSPQAAVLSALAALIEKRLVTPTRTGFVLEPERCPPLNDLEAAVLACLVRVGTSAVTMNTVLADAAVTRALDAHEAALKEKHMIRAIPRWLVGVVDLCVLALFETAGITFVVLRGPYGGDEIPVGFVVLMLGGILFLALAVSSFREKNWINPAVSSEASSMRHQFRTGRLVHSRRGGGYHETGVALWGSWAFERFWPEQAAILQVRAEPELKLDLQFVDTTEITPPKQPWPETE